MKIFTLFLTLISLGFFPAIGSEENSAKPISLFDGESLNGWKKVGGNGQFKVEDGSIVGFGTNVKGNTFLRTLEQYGDFELRYEFKFDHLEGNSGVMFRAFQAPAKDGNGRVTGYQSEADNKKRAWTAGLYDEARRGWLFPRKEDKKQAAAFTKQGIAIFNWEGWNTVVIRCEGNRVQTWLNGEKRVDYTETDSSLLTSEGFIALQVHSGKSCKVRWKNLVLTEL